MLDEIEPQAFLKSDTCSPTEARPIYLVKSGLVQGELGIYYLLIFVGLVVIAI